MPNAPANGVTISGLICHDSPQSGFGVSTPKTKIEMMQNPIAAPAAILNINDFGLVCGIVKLFSCAMIIDFKVNIFL
jgi:hypothetical protein